jgi:hypothetical protein
MKNRAHLSLTVMALVLTGPFGCDSGGGDVVGTRQPIVFEDDAGLHAVDPETALVTHFAGPAVTPQVAPGVLLSPSGRRLVRIVIFGTSEVFDLSGRSLGSFPTPDRLVGWLDDSTLLRETGPTSFARIDVTGADQGPLLLHSEVATWDFARADLSPDGGQLALTRIFNQTTPATDTEILLVSTRGGGGIFDWIKFPAPSAVAPLGWLRTGEPVLVIDGAVARAGRLAVRHALGRAMCPAQPWTEGRLLARSAEALGTVVACLTLWEIDVDRGTVSRHWANDVPASSAVRISRDGQAATFDREGALWVARPDGSQPRRLVAVSGTLHALAW